MVEDDAEDDDVKTVSKKSEMLFVRGGTSQNAVTCLPLTAVIGDSVVLISPSSQS